MNTEPKILNIPLERKDRLGYWVIAGCILFTSASALVSADYAMVFFASSVVGLPVLWLVVFSGNRRSVHSSWGDLGLIAFYIIVLNYIAAAKTVLVPALLSVIRDVLA